MKYILVHLVRANKKQAFFLLLPFLLPCINAFGQMSKKDSLLFGKIVFSNEKTDTTSATITIIDRVEGPTAVKTYVKFEYTVTQQDSSGHITPKHYYKWQREEGEISVLYPHFRKNCNYLAVYDVKNPQRAIVYLGHKIITTPPPFRSLHPNIIGLGFLPNDRIWSSYERMTKNTRFSYGAQCAYYFNEGFSAEPNFKFYFQGYKPDSLGVGPAAIYIVAGLNCGMTTNFSFNYYSQDNSRYSVAGDYKFAGPELGLGVTGIKKKDRLLVTCEYRYRFASVPSSLKDVQKIGGKNYYYRKNGFGDTIFNPGYGSDFTFGLLWRF